MVNEHALFDAAKQGAQPLARRMRPQSFDDLAGQQHIVSPESPIRKLLEDGRLFSFIVYGPPGCGKSAFANIVALCGQAEFVALNAVTSGVPDVKQAIKEATERLSFNQKRTILFIDEIHRFNKLQQDALLPAVEDGVVFLIGVTTHNPAFYVNPALLSRAHMLEFKKITEADMRQLVQRALVDQERGLGREATLLSEEAELLIVRIANGDVRRALNLLELSVYASLGKDRVTEEHVRSCLCGNYTAYDKDEDSHYDVASAFIKSMRGSDPDAVLHYLARMIRGGEDPRFIMRRIMIAASEDVGLADSEALVVATSAAKAVEKIGMPEATLILAHAALRVTLAPKSNASCLAIQRALEDLDKNGAMEVPDYLKDAHYDKAAQMGRGVGYQYPHDFPYHFVKQSYMEKDRKFYEPSNMGREQAFKKWLDFLGNTT